MYQLSGGTIGASLLTAREDDRLRR